MARWAAGVLAWCRGQVGEAQRLVRAGTDRLLQMDADAWAGYGLLDLAEIGAEADDAATAAQAAEQLGALAHRVDRDPHHGMAAAAAAWSALAAGNAGSAVEPAGRAVAFLGRTDCRGLQARAHDVHGRALLAAGERPAGAAESEQAARLFEACGSAWRRERTLEVLRKAGSSGRKALAAALGPGSLTNRERDVARLAAQGGSAREIAEKLFVSERTVETHLGNIYAKLGVESKLDLVRRAAELGLG